MIIFHTIKYKNFLSVGEHPITIRLDQSQKTLAVGRNAAGKSSFTCALSFCLFGKSIRKTNKALLINSKNRKELLTECHFTANGIPYTVIRGMKPTRFEIYRGDECLNRNAESKEYQRILEEQILQMTFKTFTQATLLSKTSYVQFMKLASAERRTFIESILGLDIYSAMNKTLKEWQSNNSVAIQKAQLEQQSLKEQCELLKAHIRSARAREEHYLNELKRIRDKQLSTLREKIEESNALIESMEQELCQIDESQGAGVIDKLKQYQSICYQLKEKLRTNCDHVQFFRVNEVCPTCNQSIDAEFKASKIKQYEEHIDKINQGMVDLNEKIDSANTLKEQMLQAQEQKRLLRARIQYTKGQVRAYEREYDEKKNQLFETQEQSTQEEEQQLRKLEDRSEAILREREALALNATYYSVLSKSLSDEGIKRVIIQKYIPLINATINNNLAAMGFASRIQFDAAFNEEITNVARESFNYDSFSEGEKLRIDLAVLMAWRYVAKLRNSVNSSLLILDEIFDSSLDQSGVDAFLDLLDKEPDLSLMVISHTPDKLHDRFGSVLEFKKDQGFTIMKENA